MQHKLRFSWAALLSAGLSLCGVALATPAAQVAYLAPATPQPQELTLPATAATTSPPAHVTEMKQGARVVLEQGEVLASEQASSVQSTPPVPHQPHAGQVVEALQLSEGNSEFYDVSPLVRDKMIEAVVKTLELKDLSKISEGLIENFAKYKFNPQELGPILKKNQAIEPFLHKIFNYSLCPSLAESKKLIQADVIPFYRVGTCVVQQVKLGKKFTQGEVNLLLPHFYSTFISAYKNRVPVHSFSKNFHEQYSEFRGEYEKAVKSYFANPQLIPDAYTGKLVFSSITSYMDKRESFGEFTTYEQIDTVDYIATDYNYVTNFLAIGDRWVIPVAIFLAYGDETDDYREVLMQRIACEKNLPYLKGEDFHDAQFTAAGLKVYYDDDDDSSYPQFVVFPPSRLTDVFDADTLLIIRLFTAPHLNPAAKEFEEYRKSRDAAPKSEPQVAPVSTGAPI